VRIPAPYILPPSCSSRTHPSVPCPCVISWSSVSYVRLFLLHDRRCSATFVFFQNPSLCLVHPIANNCPSECICWIIGHVPAGSWSSMPHVRPLRGSRLNNLFVITICRSFLHLLPPVDRLCLLVSTLSLSILPLGLGGILLECSEM